MNIIEILSGTAPDNTIGFLYRIHDGIVQHDYIWLEAAEKEKLLKEIEKNVHEYFSVEFPEKRGYVTPFWTSKRRNTFIVAFHTVSKEDEEYFTEPIVNKRKP